MPFNNGALTATAVCTMRESALILVVMFATAAVQAAGLGLGHAPDTATLRAADSAIGPRGAELPAGQGSVAEGKQHYAQQCAACHGASGREGPDPVLVGGQGTLATQQPVLTIGSFWPYATTIYDYVYRAMPYNAPQSLSANETYALTAYLLHMNGILGADVTLDAASLPKIRMPNRDGFVSDGRPDTFNQPCRSDCK